ncbi:hypothetical protein [Colwellia sp. Bg11-28]|uniref:hypothetical protein n=1 Tax=Colwellia sp. Bg11-28 TaxID=2058305 RepID=UPI0012FE82FD|nr:hypothetical protein [Colwellia sp. Bg11-28]
MFNTYEDIFSQRANSYYVLHRYLEPVFDHEKVSIKWQLAYIILQSEDNEFNSL